MNPMACLDWFPDQEPVSPILPRCALTIGNAVLTEVLGDNIAVLIHSIYEHGIVPEFLSKEPLPLSECERSA
jgi:hypothetical protein